MDEVVKTKKGLAVEYIFYSIMIIAFIFDMCAVAIIFQPELIVDVHVRFGCTLGFISFMLVMAVMLARSLSRLSDVIYKLSEGEYE